MAAVFPPPTPDPYEGFPGLGRAWARWQSWITRDLPRQWDGFQAVWRSIMGQQ